MQTTGGYAEVSRTEQAPEVTLDVETLGSLSLGAARSLDLHHAGRLHGSDDAVARLAAMADLPNPPYCLTGF